MNSRDVVRRLKAFEAGKPIPRGSTMHLEIAEDQDLLALAFVRMGGESLPWAVGVAYPGSKPQIWAVPDARNRERVVEMLTELTPVLGAHLDNPRFSISDVTADSDLDEVPRRQIWVPNGSHVQLLHMLNLRYTFARAGDPDRAAMLRCLGRLAGYLFREAARLGEATIIDSTAALQEAFTFPADDLRQQHLAFLLELLRSKGTRERRMAAAEAAERLSISISLDPELERDSLEPEVERFTKARREEKKTVMARSEKAIAGVLHAEVERRLKLVLAAVSLLRADKRPLNDGAAELATLSAKRRQNDYLWLEERLVADGEDSHFPPSAETDRDRRTGAARYHRTNSAEEEVEAALVHHDSELQADAIADGNAVRGTIVKVEDRPKEGSKAVIPIWTVEGPSATPTRLRKGSGVCVAGIPKREGNVLDVGVKGDTRTFEIEITGWKRRPNADKHPKFASVPPAADPALEQTEIVLLSSSMSGLGPLKGRRVRDAAGPGAWLTHGSGNAPSAAGGGASDGSLLSKVEKLRTA